VATSHTRTPTVSQREEEEEEESISTVEGRRLEDEPEQDSYLEGGQKPSRGIIFVRILLPSGSFFVAHFLKPFCGAMFGTLGVLIARTLIHGRR